MWAATEKIFPAVRTGSANFSQAVLAQSKRFSGGGLAPLCGHA